jgi:hypothetical protein
VNPAAFFQNRVVFRAVQQTTATTLPSSGAITTIAYDDILEDPYSGWNATTHEWLAPVSGWYQVTTTVYVAAPGSLEIALYSYIGGSVSSNAYSGIPLTSTCMPSSTPGAAEGIFWVYLIGGTDSVWGAAAIKNASASHATDLTAGQQSSMEIIWKSV